jgi:hypothetical protein
VIKQLFLALEKNPVKQSFPFFYRTNSYKLRAVRISLVNCMFDDPSRLLEEAAAGRVVGAYGSSAGCLAMPALTVHSRSNPVNPTKPPASKKHREMHENSPG